MNVLIVEDDPMVRRLLLRHFQKQHATAREAGDAERALALFQEENTAFDVVVTDVHLPGMTGVDLATRLREIRPDQAIVFVTGDVDADLARRALESGSAGYLLKPFEFFELDAAIAQALKSTPPFPAAAHETPFAPPRASAQWYEEQRRQMLAAASQPVMLRASTSSRRGIDFPFYAKIITAVIALVGIAWAVGYWLFFTDPSPEKAADLEPQPQRERTIYVPYQPPAPERAPERRRDR